VASVTGDEFEIAIIPHTMSQTTLGSLVEGAKVNIEVDVIAKYVERLLQERS
jgi:riboflavin synthase